MRLSRLGAVDRSRFPARLTGSRANRGAGHDHARSAASRRCDRSVDEPGQAGPSTTSSTRALIDINTAPKDAARQAAADRLGPGRCHHQGRPYRGKNELVDKKIIPQNAYDAIKDRIIAHQKS